MVLASSTSLFSIGPKKKTKILLICVQQAVLSTHFVYHAWNGMDSSHGILCTYQKDKPYFSQHNPKTAISNMIDMSYFNS